MKVLRKDYVFDGNDIIMGLEEAVNEIFDVVGITDGTHNERIECHKRSIRNKLKSGKYKTSYYSYEIINEAAEVLKKLPKIGSSEFITLIEEVVKEVIQLEKENKILKDQNKRAVDAIEAILKNRDVGEYESQKQGLPRMSEVNDMGREMVKEIRGEFKISPKDEFDNLILKHKLEDK